MDDEGPIQVQCVKNENSKVVINVEDQDLDILAGQYLLPEPQKLPQLTAQQISSLSANQLNKILELICGNCDLNQEQRIHLIKIKTNLNNYLTGRKRRKSLQSDNKNIPKNFTKAMFTYAVSSREFITSLLRKLNLSEKEEKFVAWLRENKKTIHNTKQLRQLNDQNHEFSLPFRILQNHFLKHNSVCYIFNSRIENTPAHLKARKNLSKLLFSLQISVSNQ